MPVADPQGSDCLKGFKKGICCLQLVCRYVVVVVCCTATFTYIGCSSWSGHISRKSAVVSQKCCNMFGC